MPTEVTPAPFRQQFQLPFADPRLYSQWNVGGSLPGRMPMTGPARVADCIGGPGQVLPNGMRNPWAVWSGETHHPLNGPGDYIRSEWNGRDGSVVGSARPQVSRPRAGFGYSGGSATPSVISAGGFNRHDDGWDGSLGRTHRITPPDFQTPFTALGPVATNWRFAPASYQNHASMLPFVPMANSSHGSSRLLSVPIQGVSHGSGPPSDSSSSHGRVRGQSVHGHHGTNSNCFAGSPLQKRSQVPLARQVSHSSRRSSQEYHEYV